MINSTNEKPCVATIRFVPFCIKLGKDQFAIVTAFPVLWMATVLQVFSPGSDRSQALKRVCAVSGGALLGFICWFIVLLRAVS